MDILCVKCPHKGQPQRRKFSDVEIRQAFSAIASQHLKNTQLPMAASDSESRHTLVEVCAAAADAHWSNMWLLTCISIAGEDAEGDRASISIMNDVLEADATRLLASLLDPRGDSPAKLLLQWWRDKVLKSRIVRNGCQAWSLAAAQHDLSEEQNKHVGKFNTLLNDREFCDSTGAPLITVIDGQDSVGGGAHMLLDKASATHVTVAGSSSVPPQTTASMTVQRYVGGTRARDSVAGSPPREPTSTASCSLRRRQETQLLANKRSKQFINDAASVGDKDHALKTSKCCTLTDTGHAALGHIFAPPEFRLTAEKMPMVVDDQLDLSEVELEHGYGDHAVVKINYSSAAWCAYAAAVNVKNGYLSHEHVRGCPTNIRFRPGRLGPRRADGKRTRPRDSEGLKKCCISGTILSAFNRIGLAMEPFAAERARSSTAENKHARPLHHMLPIFTRHILKLKDDQLRGRGYSNTLAPWNDKPGPEHSASVQESNTIRLDRELLMGGAARGIPGLALVLAWLEWVYTGEQVRSFQFFTTHAMLTL
jgi:hypothetical protein